MPINLASSPLTKLYLGNTEILKAYLGTIQVYPNSTPLMWTPAQLSSLALWLDAADASTITLNGSNVSQWNDKSGNNRHVSQWTASNQPGYNTTGINGKPFIDFVKSRNTFLQGSFPTSGISIINIFVVTKWQTIGTSVSDIQTLIDNNHDSYPAQGFVWQDRPDLANKPLTVAHLPNVVSGAVDSQQTGDNTWKLISSIFESGVSDTLFVNAQQKQFLSNTGIFNLQPAVRIGGWQGIANRAFDGEFAEIVFTTSALSTANRQKLEGYLAWKWGLESNLPANHPYKTTPPIV